METEIMDELKALIPSEYVKNYVLETGWSFTDAQKAILLVNACLPLKEKHSKLKALLERTTDRKLQKQIEWYLNREEQELLDFEENRDKKSIYILRFRKKMHHIQMHCPMNISMI